MNIYIVGLSGMPFSKRAIDIRFLSFAEIYSKLGYNVYFINQVGKAQHCDMPIPSNVLIKHIVGKPKCKLLMLVATCVAIFIEPFYLLYQHCRNKIDVLNVVNGHFFEILIYKMVALITGAKLVYEYNEFREGWAGNAYSRANGKLISHYGPKLWDGVFCISHFLKDKAIFYNNKIKTCIVPPICRFDEFDSIVQKEDLGKYILFCGNVGYREPIELIINSYKQSKIKDEAKLYLVLMGSPREIEEIKSKDDNITVFQKLPYNELLSLYKGALGLAIPLRNTIQDIARFPNKICEYLIASGVILTTNFGEISYYFEDRVNSLIADDFTIESYSKIMDWLCENQDNLSTIKEKAYITGKYYFNTMSYCDRVNLFLKEVIYKK